MSIYTLLLLLFTYLKTKIFWINEKILNPANTFEKLDKAD